GSSTPSLGIPVSFGEINNASVIVEVDTLHEALIPDLSLGTHFFNDLVEMNTLYVAHFLARRENRLDWDYLASRPSSLAELVNDWEQWDDVVRVIDPGEDARLMLHADALRQTCLIYTSP
ncbi:MAG: pyruvate, phosphate dikinase, partial [Spirochaetota bacterium]